MAAIAAAVAAAATIGLRDTREPIVLGGVTQVTHSTDTLNFDAAVSPDGKFVAYAAGFPGSMRIYVRQVSGSSPVMLAPQLRGDHRWPRWSPDGSRIVFSASGGIHVIPVLGGSPQLVGEAGRQPSWSPDGTQIVYSDSGGLVVIPSSGGTPRRIASGPELHSSSWSPDGSRIAFVAGNAGFVASRSYGNASQSRIVTVSASGTGADSVSVTGAANLNLSPVWWPDGRSILYVSDRDGKRDVYRQPVGANGTPKGAPDRITTGLNAASITLSHGGSQMAYSSLLLRANIWAAPILPNATTPTSSARQITNEKQAIEGIALSHDGKWLAYDSDRNGNMDLFKISFDGSGVVGDPIQLTKDASADFEPRWSPDDREIVFYSRRFGTRDIFTIGADGRGERRLTDMPVQESYPDWSPSGKQIVFSATSAPGGRHVFVMTRTGDTSWSAPRQVTEGPQVGVGQVVRWSPDSSWISVNRPSGLSLLPSAGGPFRELARNPGEAILFTSWARDPGTVYFQTRDSTGIASYWSAPVKGGAPRRLLRLAEPGRRTRRIEFETDGKQLFFTIAADEADVAVISLKKQD